MKLLITTTVIRVNRNSMVHVVLAGMPLSPDAPPTYSVLSMMMRIISPKPRVAIAR
ncbi:hypothetical protein D3C75_1249770 [compost metagenome]